MLWLGIAGALGAISCRMQPSGAPVPVEGDQEQLAAISGEWAGTYWSKATGRHGIIRFRLPERADTGYGEVEITFSPSLQLASQAARFDDPKHSAPEESNPRPCTVLEGKLEGNRISGSFSSRRGSGDRRELTGQWKVERQ